MKYILAPICQNYIHDLERMKKNFYAGSMHHLFFAEKKK